MSIELTSFNGQTFPLSDPAFAALKRIVRANGYKGELDPPTSLSADEAAALADAFERGLDKLQRLPRPPVSPDLDDDSDDALLPHLFSPRSSAHWAGFVTFCRRGGFRIAWT